MNDYELRRVQDADASLLQSLARACPPLDVHTPYTYWVLCHYYSDSCFLLESSGQAIGFITSMVMPDLAFIWQVGLLEPQRKKGYSAILYDVVAKSALRRGLKRVQLSIDESNHDSINATSRYCEQRGYALEAVDSLTLDDRLHLDFSEAETVFEIRLENAD
jgi:L-2,4-diaminobutyric acid acetyltransferase